MRSDEACDRGASGCCALDSEMSQLQRAHIWRGRLCACDKSPCSLHNAWHRSCIDCLTWYRLFALCFRYLDVSAAHLTTISSPMQRLFDSGKLSTKRPSRRKICKPRKKANHCTDARRQDLSRSTACDLLSGPFAWAGRARRGLNRALGYRLDQTVTSPRPCFHSRPGSSGLAVANCTLQLPPGLGLTHASLPSS
jgi:hypothetical protein